MKAVLISIQPKWDEKIASGQKTIEVRKTRPKCETPFKCYIYETKDKRFENMGYCWSKGKCFEHHIGKVIGYFVCDRIDKFSVPFPAYFSEVDSKTESVIKSACLKPMDIHAYNGTRNTYGWHITDLVVYDKPRELNEFKRWVDRSKGQRYHEDMLYLQRAPQSWCYVESLGE